MNRALVARWTRGLRSGLDGLVRVALVVTSETSSKLRTLSLRLGAEPTDGDDEGVEHFEPYGLTSEPLPPDADNERGAEALLLSVGADTDDLVAVLVADRRHRPTDLTPGETTLYDDQGQRVWILRAKIAVVSPAGKVVELGTTDPSVSLVAATDGVVLAGGVDPFTGLTYSALGNASTKVLAKKT